MSARPLPPAIASLRAACWVAGVAALLLAAGAHAAPFGFEDVGRRAAALAAQPYKAAPSPLPKSVRELTYDQYRDIRFRPSKSIWRAAGLPFELQFFHPGLYYDHPVRISEVVNGAPHEIRFDPELFDYGKNRIDPQAMRGVGFAGFRVHFNLNTPKYK
ncbi:MAG TPA: glucan biosynthesis protein, partial [Casimicrobiaceae bacterium]